MGNSVQEKDKRGIMVEKHINVSETVLDGNKEDKITFLDQY